ncbi:monofunctional biosynthetic peptidoglycan transglycosylase [Cribrihabitans marinus]|uniref:Biosynthetic peptidoglycan transglycosylase n=1 Tax=Cribrihabitans marinus TaxID=1227549 RepID=A0A1H7DP69_9RHOB|nr:monofunctional biosynthetic peptidoglycan transglycosylase [Cribrihabitans marinus]GGH39341.1 monofunctional biosynthetic peptidoglycan transglycosylase [Cribrihabitans marinus]SEK01070.1 monofunctional biosynthetic peptidoglycan transglycosylase [Cribrihabitans marinus]
MAKQAVRKGGKTRGKGKADRKPAAKRPFRPLAWLGFLLLRATTVFIIAVLALVVLFAVVDPPMTHTIWAEKRQLGSVERSWVDMNRIAPVMARSVVAAEDANYCLHWGFDVEAIRTAIDEGRGRGASTISQQVVKNVFLWQGRSWIRKALETAITPAVEAIWSKRRILEVYLNVAEMGEGVFGVEAAAQAAFGVKADALTPTQAARIAAVLPAPKSRSAANPSPWLRKRAAAIRSGAATIRADGRADCFED